MPSRVVIRAPSATRFIFMVQVRTSLPSIMTLQAPHWPVPHPDLHAGAAQFAQHVGEGFVAFHHQAARDAIHNQLFFKHMTLLGGWPGR